MAFASMWAYPWDLHDEGTEDVLALLEGELGLDAVNLAASYHSLVQLRPHLPGPKFFSAPAAVYFSPSEEFYRDTPLRPLVSPLVDEEDVLSKVASYCSRHRLKLVAWLVCTHNSRLGSAHPECCQENVFGDRYVHALCPANPAVQEYMLALCRDLETKYAPFAIELEHLHYGAALHSTAHAKVGVRMGLAEELLLSLCFCRSCLTVARNAGLDVEALRGKVHAQLEASFRSVEERGDSLPLADLLSCHPEITAFLRAREGLVTGLHQRLRGELNSRLHGLPLGSREVTGASLSALAPSLDVLEVLAYSRDAEGVRDKVQEALAESRMGVDRLLVGLAAYCPAVPSQTALEANVRAAVGLGVKGYCFYNYGLMPFGMVPWVRRAVDMIHSVTL